MSAGFCPYCGRQNPPDDRFCLQGHQELPRPSPPDPPAAPDGAKTAAPGPRPVEDAPPPEGSGRSWALVLVAIAVAVLALLAAVAFLPAYLDHLGSPPGSTPAARGSAVDLRNETLGVGCAGNTVDLPSTNGGRSTNLSGCEPVPSLGTDEQLWLNLTANGDLVGVVLHPSEFGGPWLADPATFQANAAERGTAAWDAHLSPGSATAIVPVADVGPGWCLGWWDPSGSATITRTSDVTITYQTSR